MCLTEKLDDAKEETAIDLTQKAPSTSTDVTMIASDLALSDSETSITEIEVGVMSDHLTSLITKNQIRSVSTNTEVSSLSTCDKATQTEPLIVHNPDEVISFKDGLTIATFQKALQIFVDTVGSDIVMTKLSLSTPKEPTSQIGLLKIQPSASKANQTRFPYSEDENQEMISMCARKPTRPSLIIPQKIRAQLKVPKINQPGTSHDTWVQHLFIN